MTKFFEALGRNVVATVLLVLAAIFVCYKTAAMGPQAAGLAMVAIICAVFVIAYLVVALDAHKAELAKLLEPRCGSGSTAVTDDPYSEKAHRQRLESDAMQALAYRALDMSDPVDAGNRMRQAIDAMLGAVPVNSNGLQQSYAAVQAAGVKAPATHATTAPAFLTPADIEANIVSERYFTAADGMQGAYRRNNDVHEHGGSPSKQEQSAMQQVTFCVLWLRNGAKVVGINYGSIDPARHSAEEGKKSARAEAIEQIWPLMGYELRTQLAKPVLTEGDAQADLNGTRRPDNHVG